MSAPSTKQVLAGLLRAAGHPDATAGAIELPGTAPVLPSSFAVDAAAQATIAAAALAANELWRLRTGRRQGVTVDMHSAAVEFRSERYLRVDGKPPSEYHDPIAGLYRCGDGRWVRLHTNLPHHRDGVLALLGCSHDRVAVQRALDKWRGEALETAAADAGLVVTACRSFAEWDEHPQGRAIARLPLFTIDRIGDAPVEPMGAADRPLAGVKVLDLTRIIAGPVCGRTIAAFGFGPQDVARIRPGIVYVSLCAYGHEGPWAHRRGFDSLVQTASGFNAAEAEAFGDNEPRPLPAQVLDHATGQLMAFAAMSALARRHARGGS